MVAIFGLALVLRVLFLQADPPADLSWSLAPFTDGPAAMTPARLAVQARAGLVDDGAHFTSNPFVSLLLQVVMSVLGTGLWQGRVLFVLAGCGCCCLLFLLMRRGGNEFGAVLAGLLLAANFVFIQYNRLALEETLVIFFGLTALVLLCRERAAIWSTAAAGVSLGIGATLVKLHGWAFVPVAVLAVLSGPRRTKTASDRRLKVEMVAASAAFVAVWLVGTLASFGPVYADLGQYFHPPADQGASGSTPSLLRYTDDLVGRYRTVGLGTRLFARMPVVCLLALLTVVPVARQRPVEWTRLDRTTAAMIAWFLTGLLSLGMLRYRPLRYELLLVPPLCGLAAIAISRALHHARTRNARTTGAETNPTGLIGALLTVALLVPVLNVALTEGLYYLGEPVWSKLDLTVRDLRPIWPVWHAVIAVPAAVIALGSAFLWSRGEFLVSRALRPSSRGLAVAGVILAACAVPQSVLLVRNWRAMPYDTLTASRDLAAVLDRRAVVAGQLADALTIETSIRPQAGNLERLSLRKARQVCPTATHFLVRALETPEGKRYLPDDIAGAVRSGGLSVLRSYAMGPSGSNDARERVTQVLLRSNRTTDAATAFEKAMAALADQDLASARLHFEGFAANHSDHALTLLCLALLEEEEKGAAATGTAWFRQARSVVEGKRVRLNGWDRDFYGRVRDGQASLSSLVSASSSKATQPQ